MRTGPHRTSSRLLMCLALSAATAACGSEGNGGDTAGSTQAARATEPGPVARTLAGSALTLKDTRGNVSIALPIAEPACADGIDNDLDQQTDADPECTGPDDANERRAGEQPFSAPFVPLEVSDTGLVTERGAELHFEREVCFDIGASGIWCAEIAAESTGSEQQPIEIGPGPGQLATDLRALLAVEATVGFPGMGDDCTIGPIETHLTSDDYNPEQGTATLVANGIPVAPVDSCGELDAAINGYLGLPGTVDVVLKIELLDENGTPLRLP